MRFQQALEYEKAPSESIGAFFMSQLEVSQKSICNNQTNQAAKAVGSRLRQANPAS
ncbi:hypothetical protein RGQ30_12730 [Limnobacter thiooxidans]|uniref:Uncharacterized protein n=1 Tax=Limnobacter thiooxidans TaxID=131080 RepID=A0AA86IYF8_9BURK|nr:hypothetical protein RGQ30_12730 [Limnobacter thiooxidans]